MDSESYVPGRVAHNEEELVNALKEKEVSQQQLEQFRKRAYAYRDGRATERLLKEVIDKNSKLIS